MQTACLCRPNVFRRNVFFEMTVVAQSSVAQKIIRPNVFRPTGFSPNRLHPYWFYAPYFTVAFVVLWMSYKCFQHSSICYFSTSCECFFALNYSFKCSAVLLNALLSWPKLNYTTQTTSLSFACNKWRNLLNFLIFGKYKLHKATNEMVLNL